MIVIFISKMYSYSPYYIYISYKYIKTTDINVNRNISNSNLILI